MPDTLTRYQMALADIAAGRDGPGNEVLREAQLLGHSVNGPGSTRTRYEIALAHRASGHDNEREIALLAHALRNDERSQAQRRQRDADRAQREEWLASLSSEERADFLRRQDEERARESERIQREKRERLRELDQEFAEAERYVEQHETTWGRVRPAEAFLRHVSWIGPFVLIALAVVLKQRLWVQFAASTWPALGCLWQWLDRKVFAVDVERASTAGNGGVLYVLGSVIAAGMVLALGILGADAGAVAFLPVLLWLVGAAFYAFLFFTITFERTDKELRVIKVQKQMQQTRERR